MYDKFFFAKMFLGDFMRNENLINNVLRDLDELILKFDSYYTLKNIKKNK